MEKKVLEQYIDACELIKETEKDIRRLKKKRQTIVQTNVSGSNPDFPYNPQHFKIAGTAFTYTKSKDPSVASVTFKCVADLKAGSNTAKLPYHIYTPKASATQAAQKAEKAVSE